MTVDTHRQQQQQHKQHKLAQKKQTVKNLNFQQLNF
jgi:hypothetical protein